MTSLARAVAVFAGGPLTLQNGQMVRVKDKHDLLPFRWFCIAYFPAKRSLPSAFIVSRPTLTVTGEHLRAIRR